MGGNALKKVKSIRVSHTRYLEIQADCLSKLVSATIGHADCSFSTIPVFCDKETFGDLDLLYTTMWEYETFQKFVTTVFNPVEMICNGPVLSFSYMLQEDLFFQIDLIRVANISMGQFYYGYGDVAVILGRMLTRSNFHYTDGGLSIHYEMKRILLSSDVPEICHFLGLNHERWLRGFQRQQEMFDWVVTCRVFQICIFNKEKFNHHYHSVYLKRPVFRNFMTYVTGLPTSVGSIFPADVYTLCRQFHKESDKQNIDIQLSCQRLQQEKFSGLLFRRWLEPIYIGKAKQAFQEQFASKENFLSYLQIHSLDKIEQDIQTFVTSWKQLKPGECGYCY